MSIDMPMLPNLYEQMLREWLMQPKLPAPPDKVVHPTMCFHYPGGYHIGHSQQPTMIPRERQDTA